MPKEEQQSAMSYDESGEPSSPGTVEHSAVDNEHYNSCMQEAVSDDSDDSVKMAPRLVRAAAKLAKDKMKTVKS